MIASTPGRITGQQARTIWGPWAQSPGQCGWDAMRIPVLGSPQSHLRSLTPPGCAPRSGHLRSDAARPQTRTAYIPQPICVTRTHEDTVSNRDSTFLMPWVACGGCSTGVPQKPPVLITAPLEPCASTELPGLHRGP